MTSPNGLLRLALPAASFVFAMAVAGAAEIEVSMLDGSTGRGTLTAIREDALTLDTADGRATFSRAEILNAVWQDTTDRKRPAGAVLVSLGDGSEFAGDLTSADVAAVTAEVGGGQELSLRRGDVRSLVFGEIDRAVADRWEQLRDRRPPRDVVVTRKADALDELEGVVTKIDAATIGFIPDGLDRELTIKRVNPSLFALLLAAPGTADVAAEACCEIELTDGSLIRATRLDADPDAVHAVTAGGRLSLGHGSVATIDFALGRVVDLSELEPFDVSHEPFFDVAWPFQRDRNDDGETLRIGGVGHRRGLWVHSQTSLSYRLDGSYRRLRAVVGIEDVVRPHGDVSLEVTVDGRTRARRDVRGTDDPFVLDLPLGGAEVLTISVGYGADGIDIGDHLAFGSARLIR